MKSQKVLKPSPCSSAQTMTSIVCAAIFSLLAGCSSGSMSPGASETDSPTPPITPTTAQEVSRLTEEIPLDGNAVVPLRWRQTAVADPSLEAPLLTARQYVSLQSIIFAEEYPSQWIPHFLAIGSKPSQIYVNMIQRTPHRPQNKRVIGPSWVWIMAVKNQSNGKPLITYCTDDGWQGKLSSPPAKRVDNAGVETLELTHLTDVSGGPVWKVTDLWNMDESAVNRPYVKQCEAWGNTHISMEGWTLPASAATSATGSPGS